jgi:hypothetical protein
MRHIAPVIATALSLLVLAGPLSALEGTADDQAQENRWMAWVGCWEDADGADDGLLVCFTPLPGTDGVQIRTWIDDELLAVEEVFADGRSVPVEEGGCVGARTAGWSADGARVYISSELRCGEGVTRVTSGVMALTDQGRHFLEIHAAGAAGHDPILGARRFAPASAASMRAAGVDDPTAEYRLAVQTARSVRAIPLDPSAVVEAVEVAGPDVTRALIAELGEPFQLSATVLRELARAGVPEEILDVMVAVSNPDRFAIEGTSFEAREQVAARGVREARADPSWPPRRMGAIRVGYPGFFYDPFFHGSFYGPGFFHPGFYGGGYFGRVIVVQPQVRDRQSRVSPGSGYTSTRPSDRTAVRRGQPSPSSSPSTVRTPNRSGITPSDVSRPATSRPATSRPTTSQATPQGTRSDSSTRRPARPRGGSGGGDGY